MALTTFPPTHQFRAHMLFGFASLLLPLLCKVFKSLYILLELAKNEKDPFSIHGGRGIELSLFVSPVTMRSLGSVYIFTAVLAFEPGSGSSIPFISGCEIPSSN